MVEPALTHRVEILEQHVSPLRAVPGHVNALREEMNALCAEIITLREEVRAGDEQTRRQMRVLHEEVLDRIKTLGEALPRPRKRRS